MASPFTIVANATAVFDLPAAGTITDSLGNVRPAIETLSVLLFIKGSGLVGDRGSVNTYPGVDTESITLTGFAVSPMQFDSRITTGTAGTIQWKGQDWEFTVDAVNESYGTTGFIATTLAAQRGDDIRLTIKRQS